LTDIHFQKEVSPMDNMSDNRLTFGIMVCPVPPWKRIVEHARLVESLGFDKLWVPDHFINPEEGMDMDWFDCWSVLTALATQTDKITIGTLVASMTLRNPAVLARMALTLDHISGGRLELGVGAAGASNCHTMTGIPKWEPRQRSERYKEFVEILNHMLSEEVTTYPGKYYPIQAALMRPRFFTQPRPTFNVAARGPKALRLAARYGDAWNSFYPGKDLTPKQSSDTARQHYDMFCGYALEAGRDPARLGRTFCFGWTSDGLFRSMEAFYDTIGRYTQAGFNDFCFVYAYGIESWKDQTITSEDLLRKIALEAIPALRKNDG
jgi:alkanesulfonate monooxygenase SsuD/methylene tetrahydromethanopterin reductase-like flavin-dependent oxidoreductase (luciferase family)